jgi:hypothetical protein
MNLEVRKVKTFRGHDGQGFNAELWLDGKKVADVFDAAYGGCFEYTWDDRSAEAKIEAHVKTLPKETATFGTKKVTITPDMDTLVSSLIDKWEEAKQLRRWCTNKIVFRLKGEKEGVYTTVKGIWKGAEARWKEALQKKYGDKLESIANEQFA